MPPLGRDYKKRSYSYAPSAIWWGTVLFLSFVVIMPSLVLITNSFRSLEIIGGQRHFSFTLGNYLAVFQNRAIVQSILNSIRVVVPTTILGTILGVSLAWVVVRTDIPGKRAWQLLLLVPYVIPPFIGAIAWTFLLGPVGHLNRFFMFLFSLDQAPVNIYTIPGMVFVLTIYRYAVPFIVVLPTMRRIPAAMEEAARISGAGPFRTFRDITLPLLAPSIIGGMLLLFMYVLADFGVAAALGAPNRIRLMTTQIYFLVRRPDMPNSMQIAAAYSIFLSLFGLVGLWLYNRVLQTNKFAVISGKSAPAEPLKLGPAKILIMGGLILFFLISACAPVIATLVTALTRVYGLPFGMENITLRNIIGLGAIPNITRAFRNSLFLSTLSALVITFVTLVVAYIAIRRGVRGVRGIGFMQTMVTLPYALPGTIIAIAMILTFARPLPVLGWRLYGTIWILLIAYMARFMNLGYNNISGAISQIDPSLQEAARISGAAHLRAFGDITLPLLGGSLASSFFLVAAPTISEVTLSTLLWSLGSETIGTVVFNAQEEGRILRTASLAIILIFLVILIYLCIQSLGRNKENNPLWGN
ncbi:MAG: iron ABC transporter permease [Treponema sp.]|nr:iron ABC transporter permease [Treponema sp.]